jgi:hypothetical protein
LGEIFAQPVAHPNHLAVHDDKAKRCGRILFSIMSHRHRRVRFEAYP